MRQDITNTDLNRSILLKKILAGKVLTYRRSFLDYIHWWLILFLVIAVILAIYILVPGQPSGLPFELFAPLSILAVILHKKFNRKYVISDRGVAFKVGLISLNSSEQALSYSKLRAVQIKRTLLQRVFMIGDVGIETILGDQPEILLKGIYQPAELAAVIDFLIAKDAKQLKGAPTNPQEQRHTALYSGITEAEIN